LTCTSFVYRVRVCLVALARTNLAKEKEPEGNL